jgi:hypothetical protein
MTGARILTWLGLVVGVLALIVQFIISMQAYFAAGRDVPGALGTFFSYYTILTNIILALIYLSEIVGWRWLAIFRSLDTRGMMVAAMVLVLTFVHFFLRGLVPMTGLFKACDIALHYVTPVIYFAWWVVAVRHGPLLIRRLGWMLLPTVIYFIYVLARGAWVAAYPYPVIDVARLGYGHVLLNALYLAVALAALILIVIGIDELLGRRARRRAPAQ